MLQELCSLDFLISSQIHLDAVPLLRQRRRSFKTCNVSALIISQLNVIMVCNSVVLLLTCLSCFVFLFLFFFSSCFILSQFDVRRHFQEATTHDNPSLRAFIAAKGCQRQRASNWCRLLTPLNTSRL